MHTRVNLRKGERRGRKGEKRESNRVGGEGGREGSRKRGREREEKRRGRNNHITSTMLNLIPRPCLTTMVGTGNEAKTFTGHVPNE